MLDREQSYIPIMTSEAGLCLTSANWQEAKINTMSFHLDSLLLKPGYDFLKKIHDLAQYLGWSGGLILNATKCVANKGGVFTLVSPYDGSKIKLSYEQLVELIQHIKPDAVLLPLKIIREFPQLWDNWNDAIIPFIAAEDLSQQELQRQHGVYFNINHSSSNALADELRKWSALPRYIIGHGDLANLDELKKDESLWIESDAPAAMAMRGIVFSQQGNLHLIEDVYAMQFTTIDAACACPSCSQRFTKAYLHHLYLHTPLLCQRFLIQHNVYYAQNYVRN
ncbi:tRNA guanosine transglycosylase family protein [Legionella fallonii]|uniref:Queuine tRNA-ribosyltransferase n=1 Tax=Legionella fallonii LLAP-10 TaxID=1212491 RepID=A0A098G513_9GAMM|nr:queuine tRNA-ribosyltransferase [Legionella fallonii]CEG57573.1 Queuine tRNA-ribosyltransferase [Legionella fallonii LLAP-10]